MCQDETGWKACKEKERECQEHKAEDGLRDDELIILREVSTYIVYTGEVRKEDDRDYAVRMRVVLLAAIQAISPRSGCGYRRKEFRLGRLKTSRGEN